MVMCEIHKTDGEVINPTRCFQSTRQPRMGVLTVLWIAVLVLLASCSVENGRSDKQLKGAVIILLDTLRADHLSCYGYERPTDPFISELAKQGLLFKQVVAPSPWTLPSHLCFFSGSDLSGLGMTPGTKPKLRRSLVENFQSAGFQTAGFTEGGYVSKQFGMNLGFDYFDEAEGPVQLLLVKRGEKRNPDYLGGIENTFNQAKQWLKDHNQGKFFLFIHTYEPHIPYTNDDFTNGLHRGRIEDGVFSQEAMERVLLSKWVLNTQEKKYAEALYDGDILSCDRQVRDFVAFLKELGVYDSTLIVITSDHGEELGERYPNMFANHGQSLYDELLMVPLIISNPVQNYPNKIIDTQVRLIDVIPTILDIFDISHEECEGQSLLPLIRNKDVQELPALSGAMEFGPERMSVRYQGFKYIETPNPGQFRIPIVIRPVFPKELYNLKNDPGEKTNIVDIQKELAQDFHEELVSSARKGEMSSVESSSSDIDPVLKKRLRSLGYIN